MKAWAISFTPEMLNALRAGRKTLTRRVVRHQPDNVEGQSLHWGEETRSVEVECPYAVPTLLVKERLIDEGGLTAYRNDGELALRDGQPVAWAWAHSTMPARYMPRWAARTRLTRIRASIEQLGDLTETDAWAEGIIVRGARRHEHEGRDLYRALWEGMHGAGSWVPSLWVWRLEFSVETLEIKQSGKMELADPFTATTLQGSEI